MSVTVYRLSMTFDLQRSKVSLFKTGKRTERAHSFSSVTVCIIKSQLTNLQNVYNRNDELMIMQKNIIINNFKIKRTQHSELCLGETSAAFLVFSQFIECICDALTKQIDKVISRQ